MEIIEIKENDTIVIKVDVGDLPKSKADIKIALVQAEMQFQYRNNKVIVIDKRNDIFLMPNDNSVVIVSVEIGNLPKSKAEEYIRDCTTYVKSVVPDRQVLGVSSTCNIYTIPETNDSIIAEVDVGNLIHNKAFEYLGKIGTILKDTFPNNKVAVHPKQIQIIASDIKNYIVLFEQDATLEHIKDTINDIQKLNPDMNYSFKFKE